MLFFGRFYRSFSFRLSPLRIFYLLTLFIVSLITSNAFSADVSLEWDPTIEPYLAGYKMCYGTSSRGYNRTVDVGNQTTCTISGLEEGNTYYFAATAYDLSGNESDYSNEVFAYIPKTDTDEDGIPEDDEIDSYGLDPNDPDTDTDIPEKRHGAGRSYAFDPNNPDTDRDGIGDGDEVAFLRKSWDDDGILNLLDRDSDGNGFLDGREKDHNSDSSDPYSTPPLPSMEICEIDHNWTTVHPQDPFIDPIVITKPLSLNEDDPAVVRLRNVEPGGFEIRFGEIVRRFYPDFSTMLFVSFVIFFTGIAYAIIERNIVIGIMTILVTILISYMNLLIYFIQSLVQQILYNPLK